MRKRIALGAAIRAIRQAKDIPAAEFAIQAGMSAAHLCNIEKGRRPATQEHIYSLAKALDVDVEAISYEADVDMAVAS